HVSRFVDFSPIPLSAPSLCPVSSFSFNDTAPTHIYTLSLHDALPISALVYNFQSKSCVEQVAGSGNAFVVHDVKLSNFKRRCDRSEEHTSELQSLAYLVCRLLLEKKKKNTKLGVKIAPHVPAYATIPT